MKKTSHNNVIQLFAVSMMFVLVVFNNTGCKKSIIINNTTNIYNPIDINIVLEIQTEYEADSIIQDTVIVTEKVTLLKIDTITSNSAVIAGTVEGSSVYSKFEYGVCWGPTSNPTIANNHSAPLQFSQSENFKIEIRDLEANTRYYVRPYIYNSNQYYYGKDSKDFTTNH